MMADLSFLFGVKYFVRFSEAAIRAYQLLLGIEHFILLPVPAKNVLIVDGLSKVLSFMAIILLFLTILPLMALFLCYF